MKVVLTGFGRFFEGVFKAWWLEAIRAVGLRVTRVTGLRVITAIPAIRAISYKV